MKWKEINLPGLTTSLSTAEAQPLSHTGWPTWAQKSTEFSAAWLYPTGASPATSTAALSTGHAEAYVDFERMAAEAPALRYYRYAYAKVEDGRTFQYGPIKDLEYERHRALRPPWLASPSTSPST